MLVLVTGASGFLGAALSQRCAAVGHATIGLSRSSAPAATASAFDRYFRCSVTDRECVRACIAEVKPDVICHLAGVTAPDGEWKEMSTINVDGTVSLLEVVREVCPHCVVILVSSSAVYGTPMRANDAIREDDAFKPVTYYALTKVSQEMAAYLFWQRYGVATIRVRPFNMLGPGQPARYALSAFAMQIARIEAGLQLPVLEVGDLTPRRDFVDVRDVAAACVALAEQGTAGEAYNVCSGIDVSIQEGLWALLAQSSMVERIEVRQRPELLRNRAADVACQRGDSTRLRLQTGWSPRYTMAQSLADGLNAWRQQVSQAGGSRHTDT